MQQVNKADYWNKRIDEKGNTNMHKIAADLYVAEDNLDTFITTYKNAIKEGGNPILANDANHTPVQFLKNCFIHKFFKAIDTNNRVQLYQLISSAPELCTKAKHSRKGSPFYYASAKRHLYARAMISYYLRNGTVPKNDTEVLEAIVRCL